MNFWCDEIIDLFRDLKGTEKEESAREKFWEWFMANKDEIEHNDRVILQHAIMGKYILG